MRQTIAGLIAGVAFAATITAPAQACAVVDPCGYSSYGYGYGYNNYNYGYGVRARLARPFLSALRQPAVCGSTRARPIRVRAPSLQCRSIRSARSPRTVLPPSLSLRLPPCALPSRTRAPLSPRPARAALQVLISG
jgi:hypothetical protein